MKRLPRRRSVCASYDWEKRLQKERQQVRNLFGSEGQKRAELNKISRLALLTCSAIKEKSLVGYAELLLPIGLRRLQSLGQAWPRLIFGNNSLARNR